jgi:hypothetical protein
VRQVHTLLQQALTPGQPVPEELATIDEFRTRAVGGYVLDAGTESSADTSIAGSTAERFITVNARFDNGLVIQCLTGQTMSRYVCSEP